LKVALFVTGELEYQGLAKALRRRFYDHEFVAEVYQVNARGEDMPFPSFTSGTVRAGAPLSDDEPLIKLAQRVVDCQRQGADLVLLLDDLELVNLGRAAVVVAQVRAAFNQLIDDRQIAKGGVAADRLARWLQDVVSFHLAAPMVESWLFADPDGLTRASVPAARLPSPAHLGQNPEQIALTDPAYLNDDGHACACCGQPGCVDQPKKRRPVWLLNGVQGHREQHPKAALAWLLKDGAAPKCSTYREGDQGAVSLAGLNWPAALRDPQAMTFLRALHNDLAEGLGELGLLLPGELAPETTFWPGRADRVLRNV
jgi:hypothetical protein